MENGEINVTWSPLPCNGIKINWDAAVDRRKKLIGIGLIIWVESMVLCVRRCYISDSALVEAMATRKRVEFARRLGLWSFTLEGDSILIVESLKKCDV